MQRVREQIGATQRVCGHLTGKGIIVAVLDTGIGRHPDLMGRLLEFHDFVNGRPMPYDDSGHGTHVCGILCGSGLLSGGKYAGMAPGIGLIVGKVLDEHGDGSALDMLEGLRWIEKMAFKYPIKVLNVSIGIADLQDEAKEKSLIECLEHLWTMGITVICAAGNKGPGNDSISAIGSSRKLITVGCHDGKYCKNDPGRCETYSGRGKALDRYRKPDVVAPGSHVTSCNLAVTSRGTHYINSYISKSGTSMSTPIVAGTAALFFEKYPRMTNEDFKQRLTLTASDLGEAWNKQGWGMINVEKLLWET